MSTTEIRSCEDALRRLAAHIDRELDGASSREMDRHLEICRRCYGRAEFEKALKDSLAALGAAPVQPRLAQRVRALIRDFTVAGGPS